MTNRISTEDMDASFGKAMTDIIDEAITEAMEFLSEEEIRDIVEGDCECALCEGVRTVATGTYAPPLPRYISGKREEYEAGEEHPPLTLTVERAGDVIQTTTDDCFLYYVDESGEPTIRVLGDENSLVTPAAMLIYVIATSFGTDAVDGFVDNAMRMAAQIYHDSEDV